VLWDENRRLVLCNDRFKSMRNLREEDVKVGAHWHDVMAASALPVHENYLTPEDDVFDDGRTIEIELADGRWFKINERRTREGGYVSIGTDITALKQQELHLTASEHTLQQTVEAMTRTQSQMELQAQQLTELAEKYLEQKAHAESANHAKSRFLASMSHNLRTPLNAIIGFSDMMEHEIFGKLGCDKYVEYCHDIKISGQYLLSVIDDILDMSRIEAGRIILERQPLAVETMLETCLKSIQPLLEEKKISVSMRIAEMCDVNADKRALQKIMIHILENAAKYTPQNGEIKIRVRKTENAVNFAIEDNGRGIPRDVARRLGQPFEQGCAHPHHAAQGSGLGVAIARSLTEMHGGVLRIKSTEGVGTIVLIHIPHALSANQLINPRLEDQDDLSIDDIQLSLPIGDVVEFRKVDHVNQPLSQTKIAPTLDSDVITSFERSAHGESNSQHNIHVLQQPDTVSPLSVRKVQARNTSASHRQSIKWLKSSA
jgi:two-component system cell cycle sensor histidine kinase PleC